MVEIHRHPTKDEPFVLFLGKGRVTIYNDDGTVIERILLNPEDGLYGQMSPKMTGMMWNFRSIGASSLNVKKALSCRIR